MQEQDNKQAVREAVRKGGFSSFFIRRPVLTIMCSLSVVILGLMAYSGMGVGLFPNMEVPYVLVQTTLPGASAEEIETSVTKIIEESVNQIEGIDELSSTSSEGTSLVVVKFDMAKDRDVAAQEVRDKVDLVTNELPDGTDAPIILKLDADAIAVLNIVVSGDRDIIELTEIAKKQVKENIENTRGVGSVRIVGGREREVHVIVNPFKLYSLGLSINAVKNALIDQNVEVPGGRVEQQHQEYTLRVLGRVNDVLGFNDIFVARKNGTSIKVSDIGYAEDSGEYDRESTYLNGRRAVTLEVTKQSGTNTLAVIQGVKDKLDLIAPSLPKDINISLMMDQSGSIRASVNTVLEHLILGGLLAGVMVLVFMGSLRSTFIAFLAMPISIIGAFIFMNMKGFTIDSMTLLGLTVAVGIVIDDAIVMLENIYRHMEKYDKSPMVAALDGSREITSTVVATTLSILVIFLPLAYMSGIIGRVVSSYGLTVVFAIALSGLVALTLTPMLCAKMLKKQAGPSRLSKMVDGINETLADLYLPMLNWSIHHRKTMVVVSVLCILSMIPMLRIVGGEFFPQEDSGKIQINVEAPMGTSYPDTQKILMQIETDVRRMPYVKDVLLSAGVGDNSFSDSQPSNRGNVRFELEDRDIRHGITTLKYLELTREMMKKYEGLKTSSYIVSDGPGGRKDVEFLMSGPDIDKLTEYGNAILAKLRQDPRFIDLDLSVDLSKPEYRVVINREKAHDMGVNVTDIASALRTMVGGEDDVTKYKEGDELYEVRIRVGEEYRDSKEAVSALMVPAMVNGQETIVRLDSVADIEEGLGPNQIDRFNRQRQLTVEANLNGLDVRTALGIIQQAYDSLGASSEYSGGTSGSAKEMGRMFQSFIMAFILAFLFKYMILAAQFENYSHPVAIIVSLPLTLPFAIFSLLITGQTLNIFSLLGLFMLIGVVSKNAILQTDYTDQLRARGYGRTNAILQANRVRLRPILMTTLTLVVAMVPMLISNGEGAESRRSLAIVIVGGQALSLLITLLMTPVTYILMDEFGAWVNWKLRGIPIPQDKDKDEILPEVPVD